MGKKHATLAIVAGVLTLFILGPADELLFAAIFGTVIGPLFGFGIWESLLMGAAVGIGLFVALEHFDVTDVTDAI